MKKVIKLNESDLSKLVKRIIKENLNEGIRNNFDITEYLRTNKPSSEVEYYITAEPNKSLKFTAVKKQSDIFYIDNSGGCTDNAEYGMINTYVDVAYGNAEWTKHEMLKSTSKIMNPTKKELPGYRDDKMHKITIENKKAILKYISDNKLSNLEEAWYLIKGLNAPSTIFKVKIIRNIATAPPSMTDFGAIANLGKKLPDGGLNMKDPLQNNIISYFFNTNMLQVSGNNKVYKIFSMCTAKPIY